MQRAPPGSLGKEDSLLNAQFGEEQIAFPTDGPPSRPEWAGGAEGYSWEFDGQDRQLEVAQRLKRCLRKETLPFGAQPSSLSWPPGRRIKQAPPFDAQPAGAVLPVRLGVLVADCLQGVEDGLGIGAVADGELRYLP